MRLVIDNEAEDHGTQTSPLDQWAMRGGYELLFITRGPWWTGLPFGRGLARLTPLHETMPTCRLIVVTIG